MSCKTNITTNTDLSKSTMIDKEEIERDKKIAEMLSKSPNINKLVRVNITPNTTIYIKKGKDIEEAREKFIITHRLSIL